MAPSTLQSPPLVIAHRGASGLLPEHTLEAYRLAIEQGADVLEPDLVMTSDGVLVVRHDVHLTTTTDVAQHPEFADRRRVDPIHGPDPHWFVCDFTVAEMRTLRAIQPFSRRSQEYNGRFAIPTFDDVLELALRARRETGRMIHVYPETKAPTWHGEKGLDFGPTLLAALDRHGVNHQDGGIFIQSFEAGILRDLRGRTPLPLVLLLAQRPRTGALAEIAHWAQGIGPSKALLYDSSGAGSGLVSEAHEHGLFVHPWTYRDDDVPQHAASAQSEILSALTLGIDGFFTDFPATGRRVVDQFLRQ